MCRSTSEGGRRCLCTDDTRKKARNNRRWSRDKRRAAAKTAGAMYGQSAQSAIMAARPSELALIAERVGQFDPEAAEALRDAVEGEFPGTHNMVVQDTRHAAVRADRDEYDNLRDDPMRVSQAMPALVAVERAFLDSEASDYLTPAERRSFETGVAVREDAVARGIYNLRTDSPAEMSEEQDEFYRSRSPEEIARLGEVQTGIEGSIREHIYDTAKVRAGVRASLLDPEFKDDDPGTVVAANYEQAVGGGIPVAEGVTLRAHTDDAGRVVSMTYEVDTGGDDPLVLPAKSATSVNKAVGKIIAVEGFDYDPQVDAPKGQSALYERLMSPDTPSGKRTRADLTEAMIRTAYDADRPIGRVKPTPTSLRDVAVAGKSPRVTADSLVSTGHREPGNFTGPDTVTESANRHLSRARTAQRREIETTLKSAGIPLDEATADGIKRESSRRARVLRHGGMELEEVGGMKMWATESTSSRRQGVAESRKKGLAALAETYPTPTTSATVGDPSPAANLLRDDSRNVITSAEVDLAVARANSVSGTDFDDHSTAAALDRARLDRAFTSGEAQERVNANRGVAREPVTVESYTTIPKGMNAATVFRAGTGFDPQGYVSASTDAGPPPSRGDGQQVKVVYTTRSGLPVTENRMVIGPGSRYRVLRTTTDDSGTTVVHMVDDDIVLAAGTGN